MKVAIYVEDGVTQLVLTPQGEWEQSVVRKMVPSGQSALNVHRGSFYECRGGWFRYADDRDDDSLIVRISEATEPPAPKDHPFGAAGNPFTSGETFNG